jgi:hypothetical protein
MELSGDENRIQALFSELSFEDRSYAPRFEKLWLRAAIDTRVPSKSILKPVTVIVAIVVLASTGLLAVMSWYRSSEYAVNIPQQTIPIMSVPRVENLLTTEPKILPTRHQRRLVRQRQTERISTQEIATLSTWQSPTDIFLKSPTTFVLSSLPQLDQSARDLENFLPKNNETIKESNQ